jgi:hypothetical protein
MMGWIDMMISLLEVAGFSLHDFGRFAGIVAPKLVQLLV